MWVNYSRGENTATKLANYSLVKSQAFKKFPKLRNRYTLLS